MSDIYDKNRGEVIIKGNKIKDKKNRLGEYANNSHV